MSYSSSLIFSLIFKDNSGIIIKMRTFYNTQILAMQVQKYCRKLFLNFIEQANKQGKQNLYLLYNHPFTIQQDIHVLIYHPELILLCDCCERKLNLTASVLLVGQINKDYCLTCFIKLDSNGQSYHYYIRPNLNVTITQQGWNLLTQLLLINALQIYGYGSWDKVKNYLDYHGHNFGSNQIQEHFATYYMTNNLKPIFTKYFKENDHFNAYSHEPPSLVPLLKKEQEDNEVKVQAYNSKRDQHLFSYDKQAQLFVCDLQFSPKDSPQQTQLKLCKLEEYDWRIEERRKREKFALQHQLLQEDYQKKLLQSSLSKNSIRKQFNCYSRFASRQELDNAVSYLTLQTNLKGVIKQLSKQRKKIEKPTFQKVYSSLQKKQYRTMLREHQSPAELKVINIERSQTSLNKGQLNYAQAVKKIKEVDGISSDSDITVVSWAK